APAVVAMLSEGAFPVQLDLPVDLRVVLFCTLATAAAAILFGFLPALEASSTNPLRDFQGMRNETRRLRGGKGLVGVQVAFAFVLVIAGATFAVSLRNLFAVDTGFNPHNLAIVKVSTELSEITQKAELNEFLDDLQTRITALAGVENAALGFRDGLFE